MDDDVIRIPLRARDGSVRAWAIVDREDADLAELRWFLSNKGYAQGNATRMLPAGRQSTLQHRVILARAIGRELHPLEQCDHVDRDRLNNKRTNLRIATNGQNGANRKSASGGSSRYLGVDWDKSKGKWRAQITTDRRKIFLGRFATETEAAIAYDRAAREYHGEYARLNFPDGDA